ncbi:phosphoribosylpyrophosphate synthetase [Pokkaliibacter plantistimulans]|uniref:ribose-phosphate diphosphokinase n=1 Tax=Proteobacteria bacterium 228 TaxID=2083153 RepID=A0A2S5KLP7_9PROT|nr:ribose-phosphate diphosphokinase [Pokkaliibacter plantistimulans]PPC75449.1 phosphoribosylpyrophosphate synthetase [Pokkaliibacter plantistimulans]
MQPVLFNLYSDSTQADQLAALLNAETGQIDQRQFPDQEHYLRLLTDVTARRVILFCNLFEPEQKLLPLLFVARTCKLLGASEVILATPYLCYMRQDHCFKPGEAVTADIFADLLSAFIDRLVTVDPHLHRYDSLDHIYRCQTQVVPAAPAIVRWIKEHVSQPLIVGPDAESLQWVAPVAEALQAPHMILLKERFGDRDVRISDLNLDDYPGYTPVVIDDIISSGQTMMQTLVQIPLERRPYCLGIHGVFADDAFEQLQQRATVITANTVPHPSNHINVIPELAAALA